MTVHAVLCMLCCAMTVLCCAGYFTVVVVLCEKVRAGHM